MTEVVAAPVSNLAEVRNEYFTLGPTALPHQILPSLLVLSENLRRVEDVPVTANYYASWIDAEIGIANISRPVSATARLESAVERLKPVITACQKPSKKIEANGDATLIQLANDILTTPANSRRGLELATIWALGHQLIEAASIVKDEIPTPGHPNKTHEVMAGVAVGAVALSLSTPSCHVLPVPTGPRQRSPSRLFSHSKASRFVLYQFVPGRSIPVKANRLQVAPRDSTERIDSTVLLVRAPSDLWAANWSGYSYFGSELIHYSETGKKGPMLKHAQMRVSQIIGKGKGSNDTK